MGREQAGAEIPRPVRRLLKSCRRDGKQVVMASDAISKAEVVTKLKCDQWVWE